MINRYVPDGNGYRRITVEEEPTAPRQSPAPNQTAPRPSPTVKQTAPRPSSAASQSARMPTPRPETAVAPPARERSATPEASVPNVAQLPTPHTQAEHSAHSGTDDKTPEKPKQENKNLQALSKDLVFFLVLALALTDGNELDLAITLGLLLILGL